MISTRGVLGRTKNEQQSERETEEHDNQRFHILAEVETVRNSDEGKPGFVG